MNEFQRKLLDAVAFSNYVATFAETGRTILGVESYAYSVDARAIALDETAAQTFPLIMDSDSDFVCVSLVGGARITTAVPAPANANRVVEFSPAILVQILDEASGKTYFNQPTPLPLIAGTAGFPYLLSSPRVIRPKSTVAISAQGAVTGAVYADFFFALHGAKIYYAGRSA